MVTRNALGLVAAVAAGMVFGLVMAGHQPSTAMAQVPDQGAQLDSLITETKAMNTKMDQLIALLQSGKVEVSVKPTEAKPAR